MLRGLREATSTWVGKTILWIVVILLVVAFGVFWNVSDVFTGFGRSTVARIGNTEIRIDQFRSIYSERLQQLSRQLGQPITPERARALGFERRIIQQIFAEVALDEQARAMGLSLTDQEVARQIQTDPIFLGPNGQFDHLRFVQMIRQAGYTETRFIAERRQTLTRRQLEQSITASGIVPKAAMEAVNRYQNEQRAIEYVVLDATKADEIAAPTPEVLSTFYEARKAQFRAPEYRKIVLLPLIPAEIAQWIEVSDADAKKAYEDRRAKYTTPERRHILQIVFPNEDEARAAAARITDAATFTAVAKERSLSEKDIDLGTLARTAIIDKAIADAAFSLKVGETSAPVKGRFGIALVHVMTIEPEVVQPYEAVAATLKRELATERARADLLSVYDKIEDARAGGRSLSEVATELKIVSRTIEVDRFGRDASGNVVANIPGGPQLLARAFTTDAGVENDPVQFEGGYIWFEIAGVTPARDRPLDEVKAAVETAWRNEEIATRLRAKAMELVGKLKAGTPLADVAKELGLTVATASIKRGQPPAPLSSAVADIVFRTPKGAPNSADGTAPTVQIVFRVTDIVLPTLNPASPEAKQLQQSLNQVLEENALAEYLARLERDIGVTINQVALRQVLGLPAN
jgi:peptidyl-prolyl cis-trans isomerase D